MMPYPERLTAVFEAAVLREPTEREAYLREACEGDADLQQQVEALLVEVERPALIDSPVGKAVVELLGDDSAAVIGKRFGPYQVDSMLGVGGMGEVYRATDTVLSRQVAIKLLPADVATDPERVARFRREARILASLNHPNVAAIYGVETMDGEHGSASGLVLELVEGPTLADKLTAGAMPLDEALTVARQIADALDAAHQLGIIHRDLKPGNIKVREDGTVKVLDFGLARVAAMDGDGGSPSTPRSPADSPTIMSPAMTAAGIILGTAAYMSPEQAKGKPADKRSDIWAFGCVLYEMLTGTRPFAGDEVQDVLASVLTNEPDWTRLPVELSPTLVMYLRRCVHKQPKQRIADVQDMRLALEGAFETAAPAPGASAHTPWTRRAALWVAAALLGGTAVGTVTWLARRPAPPRVTRFALSATGVAALSVDLVSRDLTVLPDGRRVVYKGSGTQGPLLFVRALDQLEPTQLVGGASRAPFSSPNGQWVGFVGSGPAPVELKKVAVTGGPALIICALDGQSSGATWGDDDSIIFATVNLSTGLQRVPSAGGKPVILTTPDRLRGENDHLWPQYLPGSQAVLFTITSTTGGMDASQVAVLDLRTGTQKILVAGGSQAQYTSSGHLVYAAAGTLRAVAFDARRLELLGAPTPVLPSVAMLSSGTAEFDIARDGTLVYVPAEAGASRARTLVWVDRQGREEPVKGTQARAYLSPRLSPDGARLAFEIRDEANDIWVWDFARETLTRVTFDPTLDSTPLWMPDGRIIHVGAGQDRNATALFRRAADGTAGAERLPQDPMAPLMFPSSVSPDGASIVTWTLSGSMMKVTLNDGRVQPLLETPFIERNGSVSPDGRWLAYESNSSGGQFQIYVRPFPNVNDGLWLVSSEGGTQPAWARQGQALELFYVAPDRTLTRVPIGSGATWTAGRPTKLLDAGYFLGAGPLLSRMYDVSADGRRFLMMKEPAPDPRVTPASIVVVQNWIEELKRLVPTK